MSEKLKISSIRVQVPKGMTITEAEKNAKSLLKSISFFYREISSIPIIFESDNGKILGLPVKLES